MEVLHQEYFAPIKSYLIFLLRSVTREACAIHSINNCVYCLKYLCYLLLINPFIFHAYELILFNT